MTFAVRSIVFSASCLAILYPGLAIGQDQKSSPPIEYVLNIGHSDTLHSVAFSPDGALAASAGEDHSIKLWHVEGRGLLRTLRGHTGWVNSVAFSPDGASVLSGGDDAVKLWDAATGKVIRTFPEPSERTLVVAFSPDGKQVVAAGKEKVVRVWDAATGKLLRMLDHDDTVQALAFSRDGARLASSTNKELRLWDASTGALVRTITPPSGYISIAFSPGGNRIVTNAVSASYTGLRPAVNFSHQVDIWNVATGEKLRSLSVRKFSANQLGWSSSVAFSPDGKHILFGGGSVQMFDAESGKLVRDFSGWKDRYEANHVPSVAFSPDGARVLAGIFGNVTVYDTASGDTVVEFPAARAMAPDISADGLRLLSASPDGSIALWDATNGKYLRAIGTDKARCDKCRLSFSADGKLVIDAPDSLWAFRIWDAATGKSILQTLYISAFVLTRDSTRLFYPGGKGIEVAEVGAAEKPTSFAVSEGSIKCLALSFNEKQLLSGSDEKVVNIWDVTTRKLLRTLAVANPDKGLAACTLATSRDGTRLLSKTTGWDSSKWNAAVGKHIGPGVAQLWDAATGQQIARFDVAAGTTDLTRFSPDGATLVTNAADHTLQIWETGGGKLLRRLTGPSARSNALALSPGGDRIVAGGEDKAVRMWDAATGRLLLTYQGHASPIVTLAFSPDGRRVLSRSQHGPAQVWDTSTGALVASFEDAEAAFSQDSKRIARGIGGGVELLSLETGEPIVSFLSTRSQEWIALTPEGFFAEEEAVKLGRQGSGNASLNDGPLFSVVRGLEVIEISRVAPLLRRPDLVAEKLAGDPAGKVKAAASQLDIK